MCLVGAAKLFSRVSLMGQSFLFKASCLHMDPQWKKHNAQKCALVLLLVLRLILNIKTRVLPSRIFCGSSSLTCPCNHSFHPLRCSLPPRPDPDHLCHLWNHCSALCQLLHLLLLIGNWIIPMNSAAPVCPETQPRQPKLLCLCLL